MDMPPPPVPHSFVALCYTGKGSYPGSVWGGGVCVGCGRGIKIRKIGEKVTQRRRVGIRWGLSWGFILWSMWQKHEKKRGTAADGVYPWGYLGEFRGRSLRARTVCLWWVWRKQKNTKISGKWITRRGLTL